MRCRSFLTVVPGNARCYRPLLRWLFPLALKRQKTCSSLIDWRKSLVESRIDVRHRTIPDTLVPAKTYDGLKGIAIPGHAEAVTPYTIAQKFRVSNTLIQLKRPTTLTQSYSLTHFPSPPLNSHLPSLFASPITLLTSSAPSFRIPVHPSAHCRCTRLARAYSRNSPRKPAPCDCNIRRGRRRHGCGRGSSPGSSGRC